MRKNVKWIRTRPSNVQSRKSRPFPESSGLPIFGPPATHFSYTIWLGWMVIAVSQETVVDYELTARIATEAFGSSEIVFNPDRMKWLYERSFGQGTIVLAVTDDGAKVGQM